MKTCWFWHDWSKWQLWERGVIVDRKDATQLMTERKIVGIYEYQRRECSKCGKAEVREILA